MTTPTLTESSPPAGGAVGSYRAYLLETTHALYAAARAEDGLDLTDIDLVLSGRRALLDLLVAVHDDVTGLEVTPERARTWDLETHPVDALGRALRRYARPPGRLSPTEVALATPASAAGAAWQQLARAATLAHHAWTSGVGQPAEYDEQWTAIADVASLAQFLTRIDLGLTVATAADSRHYNVTDSLRFGLNQALGVAARETLRLASRGPLPETGPDRIPLTTHVLPVTTPSDLPAAQHQLGVLLAHAGLLRPERLPTLAAMHARACLLLADSLARTDHPDTDYPDSGCLDTGGVAIDSRAVQEALRRHARTLQEATLRAGSIASLVPGDLRPLRQAGEIDRCLQRDPDAVTADPPLLSGVVRGLAGTTRALAAASSQALRSGDWLIADHTESLTEPLWRRRRPGDPTPSPIAAIRRAAADSITLQQAVTPPTPRTTTPAPSRAVSLSATSPTVVARMGRSGGGVSELMLLSPVRPRLPAHCPIPDLPRGRRR